MLMDNEVVLTGMGNEPDEDDVIVAPASKFKNKIKRKTLKDVFSEYILGFKLMFSNLTALYLLLGCCLRFWEDNIVTCFQQKFF
jgi:hypothetical protein